MKGKLIIIGILWACCLHVEAQENSTIEQLLETRDITPTEDGYEELVHHLLYLSEHPLNINTVGFDSLKLLFFLSDMQIDNLLSFRQRQGDFRHLNELLLVTGIGPRDLEAITPFVHIGNQAPSFPLPYKSRRSRQTLLARWKTSLPLQAGYQRYTPNAFRDSATYQRKLNKQYQGPPWGALVKYKLESGEWQAAITLENDAGEDYFTPDQKHGFDFLSAHVAWQRGDWLQSVIVGDYKLQFGQGLIAWQGYSSGKSSVAAGNEKAARGIIPYTSTDENNYLRGAAVSLRPFTRLTTTAFVSYKKTDGNVKERDTLDTKDQTTASLYESGYHRSPNELAKKHTLNEFTTGLSINLNHEIFRLGVNALYYHFSPRLSTGKRVYQQFNDDGRRRFFVSADYKTRIRRFYLFGETAFSDEGVVATVNGLRYSGWKWVSFNALYRRYDKRYNAHYSGGFAEYSNTSNEEGIYMGVTLSPLARLTFKAYYDHFRFFSPRYLATHPGSGNEFLGELSYQTPRNEYILYFKQEHRPENEQGAPSRRHKSEARLQANIQLGARFKLQTRLACSRYEKGQKEEKGILAYEDIVYTSLRQTFRSQLRLAYFDTDSYQSRLYAYEHNVLYGYSFPAYYDRGFRGYLNLNWKPLSILTLYLKGGIIYYPDKTQLSSSTSLVDDNKLFDLTLQLRIKF